MASVQAASNPAPLLSLSDNSLKVSNWQHCSKLTPCPLAGHSWLPRDHVISKTQLAPLRLVEVEILKINGLSTIIRLDADNLIAHYERLWLPVNILEVP